jgi:two-component system, chemotaxis family, chemotaxis protein CheY
VACPVLLVDDDTDSVEAFVLFLHFHGVEAVTARDGDQALEVLRGGLAPCVIVLDLMMPGKDAFGFRSEQLADPSLADTPVIVCSGAFDGRSAAERLGAADFIQKPAEPQQLLRLIKRHCAGAVTGN